MTKFVARDEIFFARAGLVFLFFSPFAILSNEIHLLVAVSCMALPIFKSAFTFMRVNNVTSISLLLKYMTLIFLYSVVISFVSLADLLLSDEFEFFQVLPRWSMQLISLLVSFFQVICGFYLAQRVQDWALRQAIIFGLSLMLIVAVYQKIAYNFGLPYIGRYVYDLSTGLRPSSLAGEPKYFANYLVICLVFLLFSFKQSSVGFKVFGILAFFVSFYYFFASSSMNGFISLALVLIFFYVGKLKFWYVSVIFLIALVNSSPTLDTLGLRQSHLELLSQLGSVRLSNLDDLIHLPILAWLDNPEKLLIGFGPGLLHFFAYQHISKAMWITDDTFIAGNLSVIVFSSNLGLVLFFVLFVGLIRRAWRLRRRIRMANDRGIQAFFIASFITGALIGGNAGIPFYLSIGWLFAKYKMFRKSHSNHYR